MEVHGIPTWLDRREGVVVVEDDVQSVIRGMREISDRLKCFYNPQTGGFDIVEACLDGTDRLVFSVAELDARILDRLRAADHWHGQDTPDHVLGDSEDFVARIDEYNEGVEQASRERFQEKMADVGERLAWALDNTNDQNSKGGHISVPRSVDG
jgi:hypothetical protein